MSHCKTCCLSGDHPGITLHSDQECNLCHLEVTSELLDNVNYTHAVYDEFKRSPPNPHGEYDCLFLYSGGKDSTYMLDKFVNEYDKRVLAYTFDVPFESSHTVENLRRVRDRIPARFIFDSDDEGVRKVIRQVFNRPVPEKPGEYLEEKLPCVACRSVFIIRAILKAYELKIPYIVMCADPQQILTIESNVREVVKVFYNTVGRDLATEIFDGEAEKVLFAQESELPKIVYPYIAMRHRYDPDRMIAELKEKGLYDSSPFETHCTLFPLLNYYSFKRWDCMYYKLNVASSLRTARKNKDHTRSTFSIKFPRDIDILDVEARLKTIISEIVAGEGDPETHEEGLTALFEQLEASPDAARFLARNFLGMREMAADLGIEL